MKIAVYTNILRVRVLARRCAAAERSCGIRVSSRRGG